MPARPRTAAGERLVSGGVLYDPIILVETIMHWYYLYESSPPICCRFSADHGYRSGREVWVMYRNKTVAVVVPAYNEELLIGHVIETMPDYIDFILIVDDCSQDRTGEIVLGYQRQERRAVELIRQEVNQGELIFFKNPKDFLRI